MANSKKSNNDKKQKSSANKVNDKKQYVENVEAKKEKNQAKADKKSTKVKKSKEKSSFTKGFKSELKKVSWPTGKQVVNNKDYYIDNDEGVLVFLNDQLATSNDDRIDLVCFYTGIDDTAIADLPMSGYIYLKRNMIMVS